MLTSSILSWRHVSSQQGNVKKSEKPIKIVNIDTENHIFWTTWGILMKFSGKMWLMIILNHKKSEVHTLSRKHSFRKTTEGGREGGKLTPPSLFRVKDFSIHFEVFFSIFYNTRGSFKTPSNIYDGAFQQK